ncbi:MAG: hypothetical protein WC707_05215 [Candidatus Babeliaceae bacterium]|jgi:hypothetical protein
MKVIIFIASAFFFAESAVQGIYRKAVVITPIVDLFFDQLSVRRPYSSLKELYNSMPCASSSASNGCWRATQALFNDVVDVIDHKGEEVCIDTGRLFFDAPDRIHLKNFWVHRDTLLFFDELVSAGVDISAFPEPINMVHQQAFKNKNIVTLIMPWHDPITKKKYSAGTRFVKVANHPTTIIVKIFDPETFTTHHAPLQKALCVTEKNMTRSERQKEYVQLLKKWTMLHHGAIPYIWGGSSFLEAVGDDVQEEEASFGKQTVTLYDRPYMSRPYAGFDCSGLVARAAQICGIPYFFKNTLTLARHLQPLSEKDHLEEGDLIWFPGHVMVVSSLLKHETIEAVGYGSGFGKVHAIKLHKRFLGITSYHKLLDYYFNKKKLTLLTKEGKLAKIIDNFVIYKFSSVWKFATL